MAASFLSKQFSPSCLETGVVVGSFSFFKCLFPPFPVLSFLSLLFGTLMKKEWEKGNVALSHLKALSVSLGFQSVLSAERKMVVWNLLCRLYGIGSGRSLFFSRCLAQGRQISTILTLLACISYLNERLLMGIFQSFGTGRAFSYSSLSLYFSSCWYKPTLKSGSSNGKTSRVFRNISTCVKCTFFPCLPLTMMGFSE